MAVNLRISTYLHRGVAWLQLGNGLIALFRLMALMVFGNPLTWFQLYHPLGYGALMIFVLLAPMTALDIMYCTIRRPHKWARYSPPPKMLTIKEEALLDLGLPTTTEDLLRIQKAFHEKIILISTQKGKGSHEYQRILNAYRELKNLEKIK